MTDRYLEVRKRTEQICETLKTEDFVVQPIADVSPPKWHLGHTAWFFETFVLKPKLEGYREFNPDFNYVFNSYYETIGRRVIRTDRGNLSRPTVDEIYKYREYVDEYMISFLEQTPADEALQSIVELGLNHEQQHQELLLTDIKYILGHNPLFPAYTNAAIAKAPEDKHKRSVEVPEGLYEIGFFGHGFCFDNELAQHKVFLNNYSIDSELVSNSDYLQFIESGQYQSFRHWHLEGWEWVKANQIMAPLYWHNIDGEWFNYTLEGLKKVEPTEPVSHISYYEAHAFADWAGKRLPTEFEWEAASDRFDWGLRWEWTESAYLPYPGFDRPEGAVGEYNGKFMVNQMVLRGASEFSSPGHSRTTYRNFFHPHLRWQLTGIRLVDK